jgi:serine/threonine protein kinase
MARSKVEAYPGLYDLLEVKPGARPSVVKAAYHALAKEFHPGAGGGDATLFSRISEAYSVIGDEVKRPEYDKNGSPAKGTVVGNYRILEEIAHGGFGTTYRAEHILAGELVCVKHCHHVSPAYQETLIQEAKAIWDLRHYCLPVMRDFLKLDDGSLALVMSYIPGPTLEQYVEKKKRLKPENVAWIAQRVLSALKYLHFNGVVHGDIKPQNIIIQEETHSIVLVDFGLSMVKPTRDSEAKGYTPVFAPPEQLRGSPLVPESDFYSLGMTLLFALNGSMEETERMNVPDSVPDEFCEFIKSLLVRSPLDRPNWRKEDLVESLEKVRIKSFGRAHSNP